MIGLIYKIENKVNGKVYIGLTTQSLERRKAEHLYRLNRGKRKHKLYQAMRKYGVDNFIFTQVASVLKDIEKVEIDFIKQYNSFNRGYNMTIGGESISEETRKKLSRAFKGRKVTWMDKVVESRRKNGNDSFPKPKGNKSARAKSYLALDPDGEKVVFKGLRQFCRDNGLSHNLLLTTLDGTQSHHKGYKLLKKFND